MVWAGLTFRSPDMLAPARIPVAAGKKMPKSMKKDPMPELLAASPLNRGTKLSSIVSPEHTHRHTHTHVYVPTTKGLIDKHTLPTIEPGEGVVPEHVNVGLCG